ncbi:MULTISPECIES: alpha/beta hydrolase family protein [Streptomyces]|uniref:alpha/beta hydrolase family protein n=1 Tax=Streptomyces TaxID=1883 RepID=UPI00163BEE01|nr:MULTISPECIES: alpha/beta hydrolase [Streptomyces]MBC2876541.1 alpha/beta hydrolase [Streptomyces sp. TYQ1024]UBI40787.1 alpha/beta hydrolase [Streptomyces mobaraensis]
MTRLRRAASAAALACLLPLAATVTAASASTSASTEAPGTPAAAPPAANTAPRLPDPTGPYAVGRSTLHLVDHGRKDLWVPEADGRELMVDITYPARPGAGPTAPYATTEEARLLLKDRELDKVIPPERFAATRTHSRVDTSPVGGRHPLVVLSPGFSVARYTITALAEDLASRGYVVASIDHAYESVGTLFPGGRMLTCVACEKARTEKDFHAAVVNRAEDASFVLDRLTGSRSPWKHADLIDRQRIGMAGHSLGGATAAAVMAADPRVRAGVNMDGSFQGAVPPGGLGGRPFMMLGTDDGIHRPGGEDTSWDEAWPRLDGWKRWLTVAGADHFSFSDFPFLGDQLLPPGTPYPGSGLSGRRSLDITRSYVAAFFDRHLRGIPQPLLAGPTRANPEVRFNRP